MSLAQKSGKSKQAAVSAKVTKSPASPPAAAAKVPVKPVKVQAAVALKALAAARKSAAAKPVAVKPAAKSSAQKPTAAQPVSQKTAAPEAAAQPKTVAAAKSSATKPAALKASAAKPAMAQRPVVAAVPVTDAGETVAPVIVKKSIAFRPATVSPAAPVPAPAPVVVPAPVKPTAPVARKVEKPGKPAVAPKRNGFSTLEYIVYPAHGVGQIIAVEEQEVAGFKLELFVISFIKDKMILKVPVPKSASVGMRKLAEEPIVKRSLDTLTGRARIKRTMWSRRAQEYEAKINSGDLVAIAEVVRDLYRSEAQPEQSYSERQLYEAALDRIAREIGTVMQLTETEALKLIETNLQKGPRRTRTDEVEADDGNVEEEAA